MHRLLSLCVLTNKTARSVGANAPSPASGSSLVGKADQHFGVAFDAAVEFIVGIWGLVYVDVMGNDLAGIGLSIHNQVAQIFVVLLYGSLSAAHADAFIKEVSDGKWIDALFCVLVFRARIWSDVDADDADAAGGVHDAQAVFQNLGRLFFFGVFGIAGLVADCVDGAIYALHFFLAGTEALLDAFVFLSQGEDLLDGVAVGKINRGGAELFGLLQAFRDVIYHINFRSAFEQRAICGQQSDRACAENGDGFTRCHLGQFGCVIGGRKDVREQKKIIFPLIAGLAGKFEAVEIGVRNKNELGLTSLIWPHARIAVCGVGFFGIHGQTGLSVSAMAIEAETAGDVERQNYAIAFFDARNCFANFFDDAHNFVADDGTFVEGRATVIHVQIAAADSAGGDAQQGIGGRLDFRLGMV